MKNISGIKKISVKAGTLDSKIYIELIEQDPGSKKVLVEPGLSAYLMSDGATIELYGQGFCYPEYLFAYGNVVVSFKVTNVDEVAGSLAKQGASVLGKIETVCSSYRYCHLLTPENTIFGIYEIK